MKCLWGFVSIYLCCLMTYVWGQAFNPVPLRQRNRQTSNVVLPRNLSPTVVQEAFSRAGEYIRQLRASYTPLSSGQDDVPAPVSRHHYFQSLGSRSQRLATVHKIFEEATKELRTEFNLTREQIAVGLAHTDLKNMLQGSDFTDLLRQLEVCEAQFDVTNCRPNDRYRTFDGTCNNLRHPTWGMASSCFERLEYPDYADGTAAKRIAMSGRELPTPRRISQEIHGHFDNPTGNVNHMFMVYGQFLDHDISLTPLSNGPDQERLICCPVTEPVPDNCDAHILDSSDPFFGPMNVTCLDNARSAMCSTCTLGTRQQTDQVTSYIDASHIYGLNTNRSRALRSNDGTGTLRFVTMPVAGELLPASFTPNDDFCSFQDPTLDCFQSGDSRTNQHPALTSMHTIFLREHNRIARRLRELNSGWDDERLYQEARRIVDAEMQVVTYKEYLPLVLGPERMEWFDLSVRRGSQYTEYDETIQATIVNEFSTAAFRFGHSMIRSFFKDARGANRGNYLRDMFQFPFGLYTGQIEGIIGGLFASPSQKVDRYIVRDVTNHLYQARGNQSGMDLASLNVNRGRDHGIPGYTTLVEFCGGPQITTWGQLDSLFRKGVRPLFERLYERVEDIDLFSGGLAEKPTQGAVIGPTFTCIIGIQFYHLKYGDRFYFEHGGQAGFFTPAQLREIKKVTLGKIVCQNTGIDEVPENAMLHQSDRNPLRLCDDLPEIDLNAWQR